MSASAFMRSAAAAGCGTAGRVFGTAVAALLALSSCSGEPHDVIGPEPTPAAPIEGLAGESGPAFVRIPTEGGDGARGEQIVRVPGLVQDDVRREFERMLRKAREAGWPAPPGYPDYRIPDQTANPLTFAGCLAACTASFYNQVFSYPVCTACVVYGGTQVVQFLWDNIPQGAFWPGAEPPGQWYWGWAAWKSVAPWQDNWKYWEDQKDGDPADD